MPIKWASSEVVNVLMFLLPGFVAAGLFQTLISNPKPTGFDVIVRAFIFTIFIHLGAQGVFWAANFAPWTITFSGTWEVVTLLVVSVVFALVSAHAWNNDTLHGLLRRLNVTRESSYQSAQYSAFAFHGNCYVVLHLKGNQRLYGWPTEWPSQPADKHFLIEECEWLVEDKRIPITGVSHILIPSSEVEMVEFLPANCVSEDTEKSHGESAPTAPSKGR